MNTTNEESYTTHQSNHMDNLRLYPGANLRTMPPAILKGIGKRAEAIRYNLSHLPQPSLLADHIKSVYIASGKPVMPDFQGIKIRCGEFPGGYIDLGNNGEETEFVEISPQATQNDYQHIPFFDEEVLALLKPGHHPMFDDNKIKLLILEQKGTAFKCRVEKGGQLRNRQGIFVPEIELNPRPMPSKDEHELEKLSKFVRGEGEKMVKEVAISFTEFPDTVRTYGQPLPRHIRLAAKIESKRGARNLPTILQEVGEIIIARGDGWTVWGYSQPVIEHYVIRTTVEAGKLITIASGHPASLENPERDNLSQGECSSFFYFLKLMGVTGLWLNETGNSHRPVKIMDEAYKAVTGCFTPLESLL